MCNNINSKALGVCKRILLLVFLLVIIMFTMVACENKEEVVVTTQEFELVSCYIEYRNKTNNFGGILRTDEYLHYGYVDDYGKVIFGEMDFGNHIDFQVTDGTPKIFITNSRTQTSYAFQLTREMYNNLNSSKE